MLKFDPAWYLRTYPQVASEISEGQWADALAHYLAAGKRDGRSPNSWFDEIWYRQAYPEIADAIQAGTLSSAYDHYLADGAREGRAPNQSLWESWRPKRPDSPVSSYSEWLEEAHARRQRQYPAKREPRLISLVTSAYNTPVEFLRILVNSVMAQDYGFSVFDWVVVDNGSTDPATVSELQDLARNDSVRFFRVDRNLGIMGGMRYGVQRATGRYVVPLDSDDYLYPDAVRIMASSIQNHGYPALLFSDEDKVEGNEFFEAYIKPGWDPVLFFHSCYIAHLCAIDRGLATLLGAYSDDRSRGCHDWDTFMRFYLAGYEPVHVPEVLYSWCRHPGSCAGDIASKDYIHDSHRNTLERFLSAASHPERYSLDYSPLFQGTPDWRIIRQSDVAPRVTTLVLDDSQKSVDPESFETARECSVHVLDSHSTLQSMIASLRRSRADAGLVRIVCSAAEPLFDDWFAESLNLLELFRDTVVVGGPVYDGADRTLVAGMYFGFDGACGSPDRLRPRQDPGYFAQMWKPHSVSAVSAQHLVVDGAFLLDALLSGRIPEDVPLPCLGEWLGAVAARWKKQVVYSPFLAARSQKDWYDRWTQEERARFAESNRDLIPDTRYYSRHLGLSMDRAYIPVAPGQRSLPDAPRSAVPAYAGALS
jgi:glycosyltransferase involved in cell wall biosynthesis